MPRFDPYEAASSLPRPGMIQSVVFDGTTVEHVLELPRPGDRVANRIVFMEISGGVGTRTVAVPARSKSVRFAFPANARVAAFVVDESSTGERSVAGRVTYFWATRKAPPRPGRPDVKKLEQVS